jgi:TRAP-type C4-dicarboxylate transport system permease large subunit
MVDAIVGEAPTRLSFGHAVRASLPCRAQLRREALTLDAVCSALTDSDSLSIAQVHKNPFGLRYQGPLLFVVGCFMEALAAMLILIPILAPAAASYGVDPVQFGVIVVLNLIIGTITPPMGVVLFVVTRIAEIRFEVVARACGG